jgi:ribosomal protein L7Ae-like RNA K-turn-binding protein
MTADAVKRKVLGLVGLGLRGRLAVVGVQQVRDAARHGRLKLALVARDASQNSLDKVSGLLVAREVPVIGSFSAAELGGIAGRESVTAIGVADQGLANGIVALVPASEVKVQVAGRTARHSSRRDSRR